MSSPPRTDPEQPGAEALRAELARLQRELDGCREERAALAESEVSHRRFVESVTGGYFFYRHDLERRYSYLSPSVEQVLGYTPAEYVARYAQLFTADPINADGSQRTARAIAGEPQYSFEVEVWAKDRTRRVLEVSEVPVFGRDGGVEHVEGIAHDISEKKRLEARLLELATQDELTGLANRRFLRQRLEETMSLAGRHHFPVSLALVDLDGLKAVNDTHGHAAGDSMIRAAGALLSGELRRSDIVGRSESVAGRLGGDEFAAVLPYSADREANVAMRRVLTAFAAAAVEVAPGTRTPLAASVGIASWRRGESADDLQARADAALYRAKREARGRIVIWVDGEP